MFIFTKADENYIIHLFNQGISASRIAEMYNTSQQTICRRLQSWGINTNDDFNLTEEDQNKIINLYTVDGLSALKIGNRYGVSESTILRWLNSWKIDTSSFRLNFTEQDKENIITLYTNGTPSPEIASMYDTSAVTIRRYLREWGVEIRLARYDKDDDFFEKIDTEWKAYWLGFFSADGCVTDIRRVVINLSSRDREHLQKFLDCLNSNYPIYAFKENKSAIKISSQKMIDDLAKWGVGRRKSLTLHPCHNIPVHLLIHYWRGLVDGDGTMGVYNNRVEMGICGTKSLCEAFKNWCQLYITSNASVLPMGNIFRYSLSGSKATPILRELYEGAEIYLDRKYATAMQILAQYG